MFKNYFTFIDSDFMLPLFRTFIARGIAALGGLLLVMTLGRLYGAEGVGVFTLAQSILLGAGLLSRYGMDYALMRYVGRDHLNPAVTTYLKWSACRVLKYSLLASAGVLLFRNFISTLFDTPVLSHILFGVALAIPPFTLSLIFSGFMKGVRKPATASLLENGSISLLATGLVLLVHNFSKLGIESVGWILALAAWLVFAFGFWLVWRWLETQSVNGNIHSELISQREFSFSCRSFFVIGLAQFMQQVVVIVIAGWLLGNADLGLFRSAERSAFLITFILMVLNSVLPPRFADLYHNGDLMGLSRLARKGVWCGLILASPMLILCLFFPGTVLSLFGSEFSQASDLLRIIALAQLINVMTGSVGFLLNMTGNEVVMRNITLSCNLVGLAMMFLLTTALGAFGAALALSLVLVFQNIISLIYVWRKLGIWVLPVPNFFKQIDVRRT